MNVRIWTEEEDKYIKENVNVLSYTAISKHLGCSISTVQDRAEKLGIKLERKKVPNWTKEEEELLIKYSKEYLTDEIAKRLNRSYLSVQKKAIKLGVELHSTKDPWDQEKIKYLKENINKLSINKISKYLGLSTNQIKKKCEELKIEIVNPTQDWTEEEIKILKEHAMDCHYTELTKYLPGRSVGAISYKLHDLGIEHISDYTYLSEENQKYIKDNWGKESIKDIALHLGVGYGVIQRYKKELNLPNVEQKKKWTDEIIEKIRVDAKEKTPEELAKEYDTSVWQIQFIAQKNNIDLPRKRIKWQGELDDKVDKLIDDGKTTVEIASELDTPISALKYRMERTKKNPKKSSVKWTKEELEKLIILSENYTIDEIEIIMGKTYESIITNLQNLGMSTNGMDEEEKLGELLKEYSVAEVANILGRSYDWVKYHAEKNNYKLNYKYKSWSEEDEKRLAELWGKYSIEYIANELGRTYNSISNRVFVLGLEAIKPDFSDGILLTSIEKMLNINRNKLYDWMSLGLIVKEKKFLNNKTYQYVEREELLRFLKENQELWDSNLLEKKSLGDEPDWLQEKRERDKNIENFKAISVRKKKLLLQNKYSVDNEKEE